MVETRQLVNEIKSFPEVLYKRSDLKNISKFTEKHKKQYPEEFCQKMFLKNFAKFTDKNLCFSLFFTKVAGWKSEAVRSSYWRCSVKKGIFKKAHWCFRTSRS